MATSNAPRKRNAIDRAMVENLPPSAGHAVFWRKDAAIPFQAIVARREGMDLLNRIQIQRPVNHIVLAPGELLRAEVRDQGVVDIHGARGVGRPAVRADRGLEPHARVRVREGRQHACLVDRMVHGAVGQHPLPDRKDLRPIDERRRPTRESIH